MGAHARGAGAAARDLRCIHTRLGGEPISRDDLTDLAALRFDALVAVRVTPDGLPGTAHPVALAPRGGGGDRDGTTPTLTPGVQYLDARPPSQLDWDFQAWIRALEDELAHTTEGRAVAGAERAILVAASAGRTRAELARHTEELRELARSAGVIVAAEVIQMRPQPDPKTVIGRGKLQDLTLRCFQANVDLLIFDGDLSATQARNLAERLELRVMDRTQLILDIFAQRASSGAGKRQVELAQLRYALPRLAQRDPSLSRLAGGIGGRGPGETKLELDRRRVRARITKLERGLKQLARQRAHRRARRTKRGVPVLSIVGYTNAGKSSLLRALTRTETPVASQLFATLDPASRRLRFPQRPTTTLPMTVVGTSAMDAPVTVPNDDGAVTPMTANAPNSNGAAPAVTADARAKKNSAQSKTAMNDGVTVTPVAAGLADDDGAAPPVTGAAWGAPREVVVTDTVGFIRDLPDSLMSAFHATLEELREADVFLHVVDACGDDVQRRIDAVHGVLEEIGLRDRPEILLFNKIDRLPPGEGAARAARAGALPISALAESGLGDLLAAAGRVMAEAAHTPRC